MNCPCGSSQALAAQSHAEPVLATVDTDRSPDEWAEYVHEALGKGVEALLEAGRRTAEAHADYKLNRNGKWADWDWPDWCLQKIGCSKSWVSRLETAQKFIIDKLDRLPPGAIKRLPSDTNSLYAIGRLIGHSESAFDEAFTTGTIRSDMKRAEAKELLARHTKPQRLPALVASDQPAAEPSTVEALGGHHQQHAVDQPARVATRFVARCGHAPHIQVKDMAPLATQR